MKKKMNLTCGFSNTRLLAILTVGALAIVGTKTFAPVVITKFANDTIVTPSNAQLQATVNQYKNDPHPNIQKLLRETKPAPLMTVEDINKPYAAEPAGK